MKRIHVFLLCAVLGFILIIFILPDPSDMGDFKNNFWGPARLLLSHRSPYDIKQLFEYKNALWMPQFISTGLFLGFMSAALACKFWIFFNYLALLSILFTLIDGKPNPVRLGLLLFSLCLFPPLSTYFLFGQASLICIAFLLLSLKTESPLSPLFLLLGLGKPQLGFLFLIGILLMVYKTGWRFFLKYLLLLSAWMVLLLSPFFFLYPNWIPDFIYNFKTNAPWDTPTLFNVLSKTMGSYGEVIWAVLLGISIIAIILIWNKMEKRKAAVVVLSLTALVSPYLWSWDFVLLFPWIITAMLAGSRKQFLFFFLFFMGMNFYFWSIRLSGPISDYANWPIPFILLLMLFFFHTGDFLKRISFLSIFSKFPQ